MTAPACSSVQWFVGTSVPTSSNVSLTLRAALIVVRAPKSASRFLDMPIVANVYRLFRVTFFSKKVTSVFCPLAARKRINDQVGQTFPLFPSDTAKLHARFNIMTKRCPNATAFAFTSRGICIPLPCGRWSCPVCARTLSIQWAIRVKLGVADNVAYFWTLTMSGKVRTPTYAFEILPSLWDNFRKSIQRKSGKWTYVAFVEGQPKRDNMPHYHIVSLQRCPTRLKDLAVHCGFGYQAKDDRIKGPKAARYVAKYLTKQSPETPKGFRRVRCSQDWPELPPIDKQPMVIKKRGEFWLDYFLRVVNETGISLDEAISRWYEETGMDFDGASALDNL